MRNRKTILVTRSAMPKLEEYVEYLRMIWDSRWRTNQGILAKSLETQLKEFLGVKHVFFLNNGTIALQFALKALDIKGEVITTPFSFAATTTSIIWEGATPVFVDIDPQTCNIDPKKIEAAIAPKTTAILAVHVYGNPCAVEEIEAIAKKHNLRVIYDAAHAFGVQHKGQSLLSWGDISTLSFHATKLFHTVEGGAIVTNSDEVAAKIIQMRNFGYEQEEVVMAGINGKNSEFHAAMGLCNLPKVPYYIAKRKKLSELYTKLLADLPLKHITIAADTEFTYTYYPVIFKNERQLLAVHKALADQNIFARRYFYPSLNTLPFAGTTECPVSESIAKRVLCLPLYPELTYHDIKRIAGTLADVLRAQSREVVQPVPTSIEPPVESLLS